MELPLGCCLVGTSCERMNLTKAYTRDQCARPGRRRVFPAFPNGCRFSAD
jgi:hypothetical protein